ncbi:MAG: formate dehydrogenase accessory sulfurtransferase FdhD [Chloroflexi bacterium]|nr:formate dehydrogenase accessory sulfurtransferase FdhD [Chloroflexota bacterium]
MAEYHPGAAPCDYWLWQEGSAELTRGGIIEESLVTLYVNGQDLATVMCSPLDQEALALGFLFTEGVIASMDEVGLVKANVARTVIDVLLNRSTFDPPRRMILTSGCGGGVTFDHLTETYPPLISDYCTQAPVIFDRMRDLQGSAQLYQQVRGVHTAVLANDERLLASAEDVGRHNAVDKIAGKALMAGIDTRDCMILTSGRISSEMLSKARRMNVPLVASRTSPTTITVRLAEAWNICVVGYVRHGSLRVYTHPERLGLPTG